MPRDHIRELVPRWRRFPTILNAVFEQIVGCRMLVPDGDRRHGSESGGVVNEENILVGDDYVVCVFVLGDDLRDYVRVKIAFRLGRGPGEHFVESGMAIDLARDTREIIFGQ